MISFVINLLVRIIIYNKNIFYIILFLITLEYTVISCSMGWKYSENQRCDY